MPIPQKVRVLYMRPAKHPVSDWLLGGQRGRRLCHAWLVVAGEVFANLDVGETFRAFLQRDDRPQRRTDRPRVAHRGLGDVVFLLRIGGDRIVEHRRVRRAPPPPAHCPTEPPPPRSTRPDPKQTSARGADDATQALSYLRRFSSATCLNGHVHQLFSKTEGDVTFYSGTTTAYPLPHPGDGPAPKPVTLPAGAHHNALGIREVSYTKGQQALALKEQNLQ
jgi:hypothetical protein